MEMLMKKSCEHELKGVIEHGYQNWVGFKWSDTDVIVFNN